MWFGGTEFAWHVQGLGFDGEEDKRGRGGYRGRRRGRRKIFGSLLLERTTPMLLL